jgi:hypothetical protein
VAFIAALAAFGSRFASKILTTALGWASTLLFGRVPASRQILLLAVSFGSVIWMVLVLGVIVPDVGAFLLLLVPPQSFISEDVIRLGMLAGALVVPAIVGVLIVAMSDTTDRSWRQAATGIARGYPLTIVLAGMLIFLAFLAIWRKAISVAHRWTDAHVPLVVEPGAYEAVARDLDDALAGVELEVEPRAASAVMSTPARWLARIAGRRGSSLVPERMIQLHGPELDILIYPMDILISGKPESVTPARAAIASRLTTAAAHLTISAEAQGIEDRLRALMTPDPESGSPARFDDRAASELASIDQVLITLRIPYEEWEVLYRQRLQVERDLRARAMEVEPAVVAPIERILREGADVVVDAATEVASDKETLTTVDKVAGPVWGLGIRAIAAMVATSLRAVRSGGRGDRS